MAGRDMSSTTSNWHLWQLKSDYSLDTTFGTNGVVDLGVAPPATCSVQYSNGCSRINSIIYNEVSNKYIVSINTTRQATNTHTVVTYIYGDLATGAIASSTNLRMSSSGSGSDRAAYDADFQTLGIAAQDLDRSECTSVYGSSVNTANLSYGYVESYSSFMFPNGSLFMTVRCSYTTAIDANGGWINNRSGALIEYEYQHYIAVKVGANGFELDTSIGTAGRMMVNTATNYCSQFSPASSTTDLGITSMTSTKTYTLIPVSTTARNTTLPSWSSSAGWTSYDGCNPGNSGPTSFESTLYSVAANGIFSAVYTETTTSPLWVQRWVIDPAGRWLAIATDFSESGQTYTAIRVKDGALDATFGTNGRKILSVPNSVTVGGTSYAIRYNLYGMITTLDEVYFVGFTSRFSANNFSCSDTGTNTEEIAPFIFSTKTGDLVTTFGTSGLGSALTSTMTYAQTCDGSSSQSYFVTSKGQPAVLKSRPENGSQAAGVVAAIWETVASATGGGEGGSGTGGATNDTGGNAFKGEKPFVAGQSDKESADEAGGTISGRIDAKVYTKGVKKARVNSAISLLSARQAKTARLASITPTKCVTLTTSVLYTAAGTCTVRVIERKTNTVLRTVNTRVTAKSVTTGTELSEQKAISFKATSSALSKSTLAEIKTLAATAKGAGRIVVVGHAANLYGNEISNKRISLNRAAAVKRALIKAGAKNPISIIAMGSQDPVSTKKAEKFQAKNRRVEILVFPAG
ncbi:MAG: OmpA family protein [Ilumatobacteraceae bacterium]